MEGGEFNPVFRQCRLLLSQLGFVGWGGRNDINLLKRSDRLLREFKNLDAQRYFVYFFYSNFDAFYSIILKIYFLFRPRDTHKVAVIYVARGQEDRNAILSNRSGSPAYEAFLAALAWEVELETHNGFLGGLQRGGLGGITAPYVANLTLEALFHVATRMPSNCPEAIHNKV